MNSAEKWISKLELIAHPEGGYFRETYRSENIIPESALPSEYKGSRNFSTQILFLLESGEFSSFHKLTSDETWHFIFGSPINIVELENQGKLSNTLLGHDIFNNQSLQYTVTAGKWFGAFPVDKNSFSLVACSVAPGFDFSDFELATRENLLKLFPEHKEIITRLTHK